MNRRRLISVVSVGAVVTAVALAGAAPQARSGGAASLAALSKVEERRERVIVPDEDEMPAMEVPGVKLTFQARLPKDLKLLNVALAGEVVSRDSAGTDLSAIKPGFMGEREYVKLGMAWGDAPTSFTVQLAPSARRADTFSASLPLEFTMYRRLETVTMAVDDGAVQITDSALRKAGVTATVERTRDGTNVTFKPIVARDFIESIELVSDGGSEESMMSMWSDASISYSFNQQTEGTVTVRVALRKDLTQVRETIDVKDVALP